MVHFEISKHEYGVHWESGDFREDIRPSLLLIPKRLYSGNGMGAVQQRFQLSRTKNLQLRGIPGNLRDGLPDGLYQCCIVDDNHPEELEPIRDNDGNVLCWDKFLGTKQRIRVWIDPGKKTIELESPIHLQAGEVGIDYGIAAPYPLPESALQNGQEKIVCKFFHIRNDIPFRLWYKEEITELLHTNEEIVIA